MITRLTKSLRDAILRSVATFLHKYFGGFENELIDSATTRAIEANDLYIDQLKLELAKRHVMAMRLRAQATKEAIQKELSCENYSDQS